MMDFCNKCGFFGQSDERGFHDRPGTGQRCNYEAARPTPTVTIPREVLERVKRDMKDAKANLAKALMMALEITQETADRWPSVVAIRQALAALEGVL